MSRPDRLPARGEPISTSGVYEEPNPEWFDYDDETGLLRYPAATTIDGPASYDTAPYARFAGGRAADVAAKRAAEVTAARLDVDTDELGHAGTTVDDERAAVLYLTTWLDREGSLVWEPSVTLEAVVAAAPHHVESTVEWLGQTHTETVLVVVTEGTGQPL